MIVWFWPLDTAKPFEKTLTHEYNNNNNNLLIWKQILELFYKWILEHFFDKWNKQTNK